MATERNEIDFGGRYLIQDQDHMSEIRSASGRADNKPLAGTPAEWVKPEPVQRGKSVVVKAGAAAR